MKKVISLLISALLLVVLFACGSNEPEPVAPTPEATPTETAPAQDGDATEDSSAVSADRPFEGTVVTVFLRMRTESCGIDDLIELVREETGIELRVDPSPTNYADFVTRITALLASDDDTYDLIHLDEILLGGFKNIGFLAPVTDVMAPVAHHYPEAIIETISRGDSGELYSMPVDLNMMYFYYYAPLFEQHGLTPPTNRAEFLEVAKALTDGDVFGYGAAWSRGGFLYNDIIRWVYKFDGDYLNWEHPNTREALQFMYDLIHVYGVAPEAVLAETYDSKNQRILDGLYGMVFQWANLAQASGDRFGDDIRIAPMPMFTTNHTIGAGWHITVNAFSNNIDAAKEVLRIWSSEAGQMLMLRYEGASFDTVLASPEALELNPWGRYLSAYVEAGYPVPRLALNRVPEIQEVMETFASSFFTGQMTLDEAASGATAQIQLLLD